MWILSNNFKYFENNYDQTNIFCRNIFSLIHSEFRKKVLRLVLIGSVIKMHFFGIFSQKVASPANQKVVRNLLSS